LIWVYFTFIFWLLEVGASIIETFLAFWYRHLSAIKFPLSPVLAASHKLTMLCLWFYLAQ
jgi:hypothetical protein